MNLAFTLAWRNLWRNKRRTGITVASVLMAVLLSTVMGSMQQGQYDQMIDNTVGTFTGHLQIQAEGYLDEPTLDRSMDQIELPANSEIRAVVPRLETYALASGDARSKPAMVVGIDIEAERQLSAPQSKLVEGRYFEGGEERGVLVAQGLAGALNIALGDSLILLGSGYQGQSAFGLYPVVGILKLGVPELNAAMVYMPLEAAQEFTAAYGRVTTISVLLYHPARMSRVAQELQAELPAGLVALDWPVLMPELVQAIQADRGSSYIILMILYMVVGFGILGTVIMMTAERKYELGVMLAIGTSRWLLMRMLILEMAFITLLGTLIGMVVSLPILLYYYWNPLEFTGQMAEAILEYGMEPFIRFSLDPMIPLVQGAVILMLTALISVQPVLHMRKLDAVLSMRK